MEKLLLDAMALDCKFTLRDDNLKNVWTAPLFLSKDRIKKILNDTNIKEVHIIITPGY